MLLSKQTLVNFALFGSWVEMLYTYLELLVFAMCFEDIFCKLVQFTSTYIHLHQWRLKKNAYPQFIAFNRPPSLDHSSLFNTDKMSCRQYTYAIETESNSSVVSTLHKHRRTIWLFGSSVEMLYTYLELWCPRYVLSIYFANLYNLLRHTSISINGAWKRMLTHNSLRSTARLASIIPHFSTLIRCHVGSTHMRSRLNQIPR